MPVRDSSRPSVLELAEKLHPVVAILHTEAVFCLRASSIAGPKKCGRSARLRFLIHVQHSMPVVSIKDAGKLSVRERHLARQILGKDPHGCPRDEPDGWEPSTGNVTGESARPLGTSRDRADRLGKRSRRRKHKIASWPAVRLATQPSLLLALPPIFPAESASRRNRDLCFRPRSPSRRFLPPSPAPAT